MKNLMRLVALLAVAGLFTSALEAQLRYGKLGVGVAGSMYIPQIDNLPATGPGTPTAGMGGGLSVMYSPWEYIGLKSIAGVGQVSYKYAGVPSTTTMLTLNGYGTINFMPNSSFNPFLGGGIGYHYVDSRTDVGNALVAGGSARTDFSMLVHGGFDLFLSEFISVTASADYAIMTMDWLDGYKGGGNDSYIRAGLEIRYYFFDQGFLTRLLEALKARYEN